MQASHEPFGLFWDVHPPTSRLFLGVQLGLYMCTTIWRTTVQQRLKKCSDAPSRAQLFPNSILLPAHPGRLPQGFQEPAWTRKDHWSLQQLLSFKGVWFETGRAWHVALVVRTKNVCVTSCRGQAGKVGHPGDDWDYCPSTNMALMEAMPLRRDAAQAEHKLGCIEALVNTSRS